jgi:hypothetical protein
MVDIIGSDRALVLLENERARALLDAEMKYQIAVGVAAVFPVTSSDYSAAVTSAALVKNTSIAAAHAALGAARKTLHR